MIFLVYFSRRVAGEEKTSSSLCSFCCWVFIVRIWSQQVYELISWLRSANQNGRNPIYLVQFLIIINIHVFNEIALPVYLRDYLLKGYTPSKRLGKKGSLEKEIFYILFKSFFFYQNVLMYWRSADSSVFVLSLHDLDFKCVNWHMMFEVNGRRQMHDHNKINS